MDKLLEKKTIKTSRGLNYTYYASPSGSTDTSKPAFLLCHGFPDDAHLWVKIVPHLQKLKQTIVAPDLLGYDGTDKPSDASLYNSKDLTKDLADILDHENVKSVIYTGHDWGSFVASRMWLWHPERCVGMVLLNVAYQPPRMEAGFDLDEVNKQLEATVGHPLLAYWYLFTAPDGAQLMKDKIEAVYYAMHGDQPNLMEALFCVRGALRDFVENDKRVPLKPYAQDKAFHDRFVARMQRDGFEAPNNYYFAMKDNHHFAVEKTLDPARLKVTVPLLFLGCDGDAVCRTDTIYLAEQAGLLPELKVKEFHSAHWSPFEVPDQIGDAIVEWAKETTFEEATKL